MEFEADARHVLMEAGYKLEKNSQLSERDIMLINRFVFGEFLQSPQIDELAEWFFKAFWKNH